MIAHARTINATVVGMLAVAVCACATLRVNSFVERGADFSRYRTYTFGPAPSGSTGDPRLDNNRFFYERVERDVDQMLAARGYEKKAGQAADMVVHYHASVSQQIELNDDERNCVATTMASGRRTPTECAPYVYDAGTLLIDIVDGRTHKLAWRGWVEGSMDGVLANQKWMEERIDETVRRIFDRLPSAASPRKIA